LKSVFAMLDELVTGAAGGFQGMLRRVNLQDVIQMNVSDATRPSWRSTIGSERKIYIEDEASSTRRRGATGERRSKLLSLSAGAFQLQPSSHRRPPPSRPGFLLMEPRGFATKPPAPPDPQRTARILETPPPGRSRSDGNLDLLGQGQPLYQWQCAMRDRVELLKKISQYGARLGRLLPLGNLTGSNPAP